MKGSYTVDKNGTVSVNWENGTMDTYWMYVQDDCLYMIEFGLDDFGEMVSRSAATRNDYNVKERI